MSSEVRSRPNFINFFFHGTSLKKKKQKQKQKQKKKKQFVGG